MKTRDAKTKGREFQDSIADLYKKMYNIDDNEVDTSIMGESGPDVYFTSKETRSIIPHAIEAKHHKAGFAKVYKTMAQAIAHAEFLQKKYCKERSAPWIPIAFIKQNYSRPLVVMDAEQFLNLAAQHALLSMQKYIQEHMSEKT